MAIQAGKLRDSITLQQRDAGQDGGGQPASTWTVWQTVWARVVSVRGSEELRNQQFSAEVTHVVTIRWLDGVTPMHRIVTGDGKILDILSVNYGERRLDDTVMITTRERITQAGDEDVG